MITRTSQTSSASITGQSAFRPAYPLRLLSCLMLISVSLAVFSYKIDRPWIGNGDWNSAKYSGIARNHQRYGLAKTRLGQVYAFGTAHPLEEGYYINNPPVYPLLLAGVFRLFGESEGSARLTSAFFSAFSIALIFLIGVHLRNLFVGAVAGIFAIATPMFAYYGKTVAHEPSSLFFSVLIFYLYLRWRDSQSSLFAGLALMSGLLGMLFGWQTYFAAFVVLLCDIWSYRKVDIRVLSSVMGVALLSLAVLFSHIHLLQPSSQFGLLGTHLLQRILNLGGPAEGRFTLFSYALLLAYRIIRYFTPVLVALAGLEVWYLLAFKRPLTRESKRLISLLLFGFVNLVLFPQAAKIHDYFPFYLIPGLSLLAAFLFDEIRGRIEPRVLRALLAATFVAVTAESLFFLRDTLYRPAEGLFELSRLGLYLRSQSAEDQCIFVSFELGGAPFLEYYADRCVVEKVATVPKMRSALQKHPNTKYVVVDNKREKAPIVQYLKRKSDPEEFGQFRIFQLGP